MRERCGDCPLTAFEESMDSGPGVLLRRASDLMFELDAGFTLSAAEVNVEEYKALQILWSERNRHRDEKMKQPDNRNVNHR